MIKSFNFVKHVALNQTKQGFVIPVRLRVKELSCATSVVLSLAKNALRRKGFSQLK
jgi:hypothetical protein